MRLIAQSLIVIVVVFVSFQASVYAQERVSPGDLLCWLPDQPYRLIEFCDFAALRNAEIWKAAPPNYYNRDEGGWFIEDITARLTAVPLKVQWRGDEAPPTNGDMDRAEWMIPQESAEVLKGYEIARREIRIFAYEDVDPVLEKAVEVGVLVQCEEGYRGYDFYQMSRPVSHEKTGRWVVTAVEGRYLFMAPSALQLQHMLDTNGRTESSALGGVYFDELLMRLDELGQKWRYEATAMTISEISDAIAEANGWPAESLERVREKQRQNMKCKITSEIYDEEWYTRIYYYFDPEIPLHESKDARRLAPVELGEAAEPRPIPPELEFQVRIEGNVIIHSMRRDVLARKRWKEMMEMRARTMQSRGKITPQP